MEVAHPFCSGGQTTTKVIGRGKRLVTISWFGLYILSIIFCEAKDFKIKIKELFHS